MVQIRTTRKISEIFTIKAHDIEVVGNCKYKYQGAVISNTNDETEEMKAPVLAANEAYSSLLTVFRSQ